LSSDRRPVAAVQAAATRLDIAARSVLTGATPRRGGHHRAFAESSPGGRLSHRVVARFRWFAILARYHRPDDGRGQLPALRRNRAPTPPRRRIHRVVAWWQAPPADSCVGSVDDFADSHFSSAIPGRPTRIPAYRVVARNPHSVRGHHHRPRCPSRTQAIPARPIRTPAYRVVA